MPNGMTQGTQTLDMLDLRAHQILMIKGDAMPMDFFHWT